MIEIHIPGKIVLNSTHWGRVTHIWVGNLVIIGSDNGLSPVRRQAIIWTNAGKLLIWPLGTNFSEFLIEILTISVKKMRLKVSSAKWGPFCLGLNVLSMAHPVLFLSSASCSVVTTDCFVLIKTAHFLSLIFTFSTTCKQRLNLLSS